ncbi:MAG TPA: ATP-binding protein [Anaerolineales bacterium]|nr:ATP-binding protein [Anaerolineales bacterium]
MNPSKRWWSSFPFVFALVALIVMGISAARAFRYPYDGIFDVDQHGIIHEIDDQGVENQLQVEDKILTVGGIPFERVNAPYAQLKAGDQVQIVIARDGKTLPPLTITLTTYPPTIKVEMISIFLIGFAFWGVGMGVLAFKPGDAASLLFFLFSQAAFLLLSSGLISAVGPEWTSDLFNLSLWLIGPLAVHFHLIFPQEFGFNRRRIFLRVLYGIAILGGLPYVLIGASDVRASAYGEYLQTASRLFLTLNLLFVVWLLLHDYRYAVSPGVRSKIRIVVLGGVLSLLPPITLTILPEVILGQPIIPYTEAFLFLAILPLTYGYAIIRHRLIEIDRHVNRGAAIFLVFSILGGIYTVLYSVLHNYLPFDFAQDALLNTLLVLILSGIFPPLYRFVRRIVDTAFYGSWYDYRSAVAEITQGLEQITELPDLAGTIGGRLAKTLQLENTCVFLRDLEGDFSVIEVAPEPRQNSPAFSTLPKNSLTYLLKIGMVGRNSLRKSLSEVRLSNEERELLESDQIYLWVPVTGHGQVLGLLALGGKLGGDVFSGEDMDILRIVGRQMGPLIENIHLLTRLREYAAELEQRVEERTAELHAAKERVEAVLSSVGDGVIVTDLDGRILTVNNAYVEQSGYQEVEVIGQPIFSMLNGSENKERTEEIEEALTSKHQWNGELMVQRKGGRHYDIQLTLAPVRNQVGEIMGYVGSQRDITQYKELERLKDQFILEVSHELRTPVTNMGLFAELLERGKPEKKSEYLAVLRTEIHQLMKMIEDILDLSRLEVGKYKKSSFGPIDLNLLADQVVAAHAPMAQRGGLALVCQLQQNLPLIDGEQTQLARVLTNLLSNSIRYTHYGTIWVRTGREDNEVYVEIEDTGTGIDAEDLPHLFERFYRGRKVSQSKILGSGLGLAIVKEIVELHDGRIEWESEVGKGSTFRVYLPLIQQELIPMGV